MSYYNTDDNRKFENLEKIVLELDEILFNIYNQKYVEGTSLLDKRYVTFYNSEEIIARIFKTIIDKNFDYLPDRILLKDSFGLEYGYDLRKNINDLVEEFVSLKKDSLFLIEELLDNNDIYGPIIEKYKILKF
ncbi:MAG: hypothetical protein QXR30_04815 [Candidatus Woesearchaeota archaeon]